MAFFLLGQVEDTGGDNPREPELVYRFFERYLLARAATKSRMRIYEFLTLMRPVGLAALTYILASFMEHMSFLSLSLPTSLQATGGGTVPIIKIRYS